MKKKPVATVGYLKYLPYKGGGTVYIVSSYGVGQGGEREGTDFYFFGWVRPYLFGRPPIV